MEQCRGGNVYQYAVGVDDEEKDVVSFSFSNDVPAWLSIDQASGLIKGSPPQSEIGKTYEIRIRAYEALFGHEVFQTYHLTVGESNQDPVVTSVPNTTAEAGQLYSYTIEAEDPEGDDLTYTMIHRPYWLQWDNKQNRLYGTAKLDYINYANSVEIQVTDSYGGENRQRFDVVIVNPSNQVPSFSLEPIRQAYVGLLYAYETAVIDDQQQSLHYTLVSGPDFLYFDHQGRLMGYPGQSDIGTYTVRINVMDEFGAIDNQEFLLVVSEPPHKPGDLSIKVTDASGMLTVMVYGAEATQAAEIKIVSADYKQVFQTTEQVGQEQVVKVTVNAATWLAGKYFIIYNGNNKTGVQAFEID